MYTKIFLFFSVSLMFLHITACSHSPSKNQQQDSQEVLPFVGKFNVYRYKLTNGLKLLVIPDHTSPTFAYNTWFNVGSRHEKPGYTGLAHLFEHMMFRETKNLKEGEFDKTLEKAGVEHLNAFTSRDYTAYVQQLAKTELELIIKLESERMQNLIVDDRSFKTEREVVQNERKFRTDNNPDGKLFEELYGLSFTNHSYRWPVIGYAEDLARMSAQDAREFYQTHYTPNQATLCISGDVEPDHVFSLVKKYYGEIPSKLREVSKIPQEPKQTQARKKIIKLNTRVEKLFMGYLTPEVSHPDTAGLVLIRSLLSLGKSSRLYQALVDTGIASSVSAYESDDYDPSLFLILVTLQSGKSANLAEHIILKELERLSKEPVSLTELNLAMNKIDFEFYSLFETHHERANFLGRYETVTGDFRFGLELLNKLKQVSSLDIQLITSKYFKPQSKNVIIGISK